MKNTMKNFTPTKDQIRAAEAVFTAMAFEATVRPIVETYELAILEKHQFRISRKWVEKGITDRLVLERKDTFLLDDEDAKVYYAECFAARDAAKLAVDDPEHCPLLVASVYSAPIDCLNLAATSPVIRDSERMGGSGRELHASINNYSQIGNAG